MDKITIAANGADHFAAEVGSTIERLFNGFHGKVRVATVDDLEDKENTLPFGIFRDR